MIDHVPPTLEVDKPWGAFEQYTHNVLSSIKLITVYPGGTLSLQFHHRRDELWVILDPGALIELGDSVLEPQVGEDLYSPRDSAPALSYSGRVR
jgi:mannose-6-phosphate isomerase